MKTKVSEIVITESLNECMSLLKPHGLNFTIDDIRSSSRDQELNGIRSLVCVILRDKGYSLAKIGGILNRDHSQVLHAINNYSNFSSGRLENYKLIRDSISRKINKDKVLDRRDQIITAIRHHRDTIDKLKKLL